MDVYYTLEGEHFVWDSRKEQSNRAKHGLSFQKAAEVFLSPFAECEGASVESEQREAVIGLTLDLMTLYVVHIIHQNDLIRIISARPVTSEERSHYENNQ